MTLPEQANVALELERLRSAVDVGFARVDGQLALLVQRSDQVDKQLAEHETRLDAMERNRWPLPSLAAAVSITALGLTAYDMIAH